MTRFSSWLLALRRAVRPCPVPRRRGVRPGVETLEARDVPAVFLVTNTDDSGGGTLRQAILDANNTPNAGGPDQIRFDISGPSTEIFLNSALPNVTEAVVIDGTTQPGSGGLPAVQLNGAGVSGDGLVLLNHTGSTVKGMVINRFGGSGIRISGGGGHTVTDDFIGTSAGGNGLLGNNGDGVLIDKSAGNTLSADTISANGGNGVEIFGLGSTNNTVQDCKIGTDSTGTAALGNGIVGVFIHDGPSANLIAVSILSANRNSGIELRDGTANNTVRGNKIGTDVSGTLDRGNGALGVTNFVGAT